ncbi:MAG: NAD(P)-dependent oxidoreductase [Gemmatimonadales bacterium]|jgi:3-hydroxyisobutyrate dehydrogenase-like beta-hydroxyacid dehydrogenase
MNVGFIGLGAMGLPIARNLLKTPHWITVYNRTSSRAEALQPDGARVGASTADASRGDVVLTMLADDAAVEATVFGGGGVLEALPRDGIHVSLSTISTALSRRLAEAHATRGQQYVAAPVFGRPDAAAAQRLVVVAAGPALAIERVRPLLEAIGRKLFVIGAEASAANTLKLAGNFVIVAMLESLAEAFALLRKSGVEPALFLEIVNDNLMQSPMYKNYGALIAQQRYEPAGFKLRLGLKDVRLVMEAAEARGVPMPLAALVRDQFDSAIAAGMGDLDWSALGRLAAQRAGL